MKQNTSSAVMQQRHEAIDSLDYFPTPPWATRAFLREILQWHPDSDPFKGIWEPACGEGHMFHVLGEFSRRILASDVHNYGKGYVVGSFVGQGPDVVPSMPACDWVITNPPFNLAVEFAERAIAEARVGVALLVRSAWSEGAERYNRLFSKRPPAMIVQYCDRVPMVKGRYDPKASTATSYSWFVWHHLSDNAGTRFHWIKPGAKERNIKPQDLRRWAT